MTEVAHVHEPKVHLCNPPAQTPYMIICDGCRTVMWGEVTPEQASLPDEHESLTPEALAAYAEQQGAAGEETR